MSTTRAAWRFVPAAAAELETLVRGTHNWYCKPGMVSDTDLIVVKAVLHPGQAHKFHRHPKMEEVLYFLKGRAEQWVDQEKSVCNPGDAVIIPANMVHATYNITPEPLEFLAILTPGKATGPATIDVFGEEPWSSLRKG